MLFHQHVARCDEMCLTSQTASLSFWVVLSCSVSDITNGLIVSFAICCCRVLLHHVCFSCQVDSGSWDTEIQDDVGLHMHRRTGAGGTAPVRFSLCVMQ